MAEPNPPPSTCQLPRPSPPAATAEQHHFRSLDDTIERYIGNMGWKQFLQFTIVSFAWFFDAQQTFISIFTDAEPKWSCRNSTTHNNNSHFSSCNSTTSTCQLPRSSWSWDLPAHTSTISQWSLQCESPIIRGLPASSFLLGCLVGGLALATLADSNLGRKNMLVLSCLSMSVSGGLTAISKNIWMYVGLRFISGVGRSTIGTCAFVLGSELVGRKWRGRVGIFGLFCYTLGFLSLPITAYLLRGSSWRLIYICTCGPCVCYSLLVYFWARESPRWLFVKGRKEEFLKTLRSLTPRNALTEDVYVNCLDWTEKSQEHHFYYALMILLEKRWALKRLLGGMVAGFGTGMAYYGMPLGLNSLPFNLYLSVGLNALSESLSSTILLFVIGKVRRKASVMGLCLFSGTCNMASAFVRLKGLKMGMELLSFFSACMAFNVSLIYMSELFPTCVRNTAMSMMREASLLGGFLGPVVVAVAGKNGFLSYGVFGVTILLCGMFVVWLPETKGRVLCDTLEEEEGKDGGVRSGNGVDCA